MFMKSALKRLAMFAAGPVLVWALLAQAGTAGAGHVWQMRKVTFVDAGASQANIPAGTMLMPADWTVRATGNYVSDCVFSPARLVLQASRRDGSLGLNIYPGMVGAWSDNPQVAEMYRTRYPEFKAAIQCTVKAPAPIDAALHEALASLGGVQPVGGSQAVPGLSEELPNNVKKVNQELAGHPGAGSLTAEAGRIRFSGALNGRNVEGWLVLMLSVRTMPAPNGAGTVQLIDAPLICVMYAAPGELDGNEKMLTAMLGSIQLDPNWLNYTQQATQQVQQIMQNAYARVANIHNQMMQDNLRTQQKIAAIRQGTADYARQVRANVASDRAAALDHNAQQFSLYMGDEATYKNPSTGERVQMSSAYGHAWASTTGNSTDYVLTDSASYDPNGKVGGGSWTQLLEER
jgi:hypothetical protein